MQDFPGSAGAEQQPTDAPQPADPHSGILPGPSRISPPLPPSPGMPPGVSPVPQMETIEQDGIVEHGDSYVAAGSVSELVPHERSLYPKEEIALLLRHDRIKTRTCNGNVLVYVRPDDRNRDKIPVASTKVKYALKTVMSQLDPSPEAWKGQRLAQSLPAPVSDGTEDDSLWYIFNTLDDPNPRPDTIKDGHACRAMEDLLCDSAVPVLPGLKTPLYPYQRRSAATMVQREAQPALMLDPRLEACQGPTGAEYYWDKVDGTIFCDKRQYSEACGGILSETMGCGKTLISLAVILATRGHFPKIPIQYLKGKPVREKTGTLVEMTAAAAGRFSLPWKTHFDAQRERGKHFDRCVMACESHCGSYEIPPHETRYQGRHSTSYTRPPPQRIQLCIGTLIVVPPNLVDHWRREIATHTQGLQVLVIRRSADVTPSAERLSNFDIVLFSKTRFEREAGEPNHNRRGLMPIESPLTKLHWLRIIVDEGHNVAGHGSKTNMVHLINHLHIERRWIISGTPSSGLYGVEISLSSQEANASDPERADEAIAAVLDHRKKTGNAVDNELKDLDRLRRIVIEFLDLKPWSNSRADDPADWTTYIKPLGKNGKRRKSPSLRATLQSLVVRHRLDMVNQEVPLPKLHNRVVYLEPTFYDKMSINLFLFGLAVNTVTSERQGPDYMFNPNNRKHLNQTINNLRQAGFWWAGSDVDIQETVNHALKYLNEKHDQVSPADAALLMDGMQIAQKAMNSARWCAFKQRQELGVVVQNFPNHARDMWALESSTSNVEPMLMGITQARNAQQFVTKNLRAYDPAEGLPGDGIKFRQKWAKQRATTKGAPESAYATANPKALTHNPKPLNNKSPQKTFTKNLFQELSSESTLKQTRLVATASAKLSYLLDQILKLHSAEKIIIFYENNNTAFWIAEGLELLGVEFRIYANTLSPNLRTEYLQLFHESEEVRVLLMDLRQASHGLHLAQASRVFIVDPIWQPNVESQAIKRAHRIGQTREVYVETLVLRDTLEDRMLRRRKEMSEAEMQHAEKSLLDDNTMSGIIQRERFLPMPNESQAGAAFLKHPPGFFDRHRLPIPDNEEEVVVRTLFKRAHREILESDADSDFVTEVVAKQPRVGFAPSVSAPSPQLPVNNTKFNSAETNGTEINGAAINSAETPSTESSESQASSKQRGRMASLTNNDAKNFVCSACSRRFARQEHLKRHINSVHSRHKPFECPDRGFKCSRSDNLAQHLHQHATTWAPVGGSFTPTESSSASVLSPVPGTVSGPSSSVDESGIGTGQRVSIFGP